jgi:glutathione S-transferase
MKLYMHPVSMTSRPVRLFIAESGIDVEEQVVDLMTGEHLGPAFAAVNPNKMVPVLEDGDLRLTESSAILKYLADKVNSPAYPKDLKQRAKVNEAMDWFNSNFYRDFGYGLCYPQLFPHHKRPTDAVQKATLEWAQERTKNWLKILNDDIIGSDRRYLVGNTLTIADYFGVCLLTLGEITRCDWSKYPNVKRWVDTMKQLKSWSKVNEVLYGYAGQVKDQQFVTV